MSVTTSILLADSQIVVREGLRRLLEQHEGFVVVAEESDGESAAKRIEAEQPDIAILEFAMPRLSGVEAIARVAGHFRTRCLILTTQHGGTQVQDALRAGAAGYMLKTAPASQLIEAVEVVRDGKFFFSPDVSAHLVDAARKPHETSQGALHGLTRREREVLQLVAEELSTKEIAGSLGIAVRTAESHRARLMHKLDIHKVPGLVRLAIREGLIEA